MTALREGVIATNSLSSAPSHLPWVDLARGLAALAVVAGHLRYFLFEGLEQDGRLFWRAFDLLTAQGHAAVIVFFVLSGFLVGGSVHESLGRNSFSWRRYWVQRLTRLWIVLLPALVLTALLDAIGRDVLRGSLYAGQLGSPARGGSLPDGEAAMVIWNAATFLGNAAFLQRLAVPTFGTNSPLWSLSYEFWYYAAFPLILHATRPHEARITRISAGAAATFICTVLPLKVVVYGALWGFGYAAFLATRLTPLAQLRKSRAVLIGAVMLFGVVLFWAPRWRLIPVLQDAMTAACFALLLWRLTEQSMNGGLARMAGRSASVSYTLYLTHFPFLALALTFINDANPVMVDAKGLGIYCAMLTAALAYAVCIWWMFERHTRWLQDRLNGSHSTVRTA